MTHVAVFEKTLQESNRLLHDIEKEFGWDNQPEIAYNALRAVLHVLRDRLTIEEAADFSAQLPMLIKGLFYDGWRPGKMPVKMSEEEFLAEVRRLFPLSMEHSTKDLIHGILVCLSRYVSKGEIKEVQEVLPEKLANYIKVA